MRMEIYDQNIAMGYYKGEAITTIMLFGLGILLKNQFPELTMSTSSEQSGKEPHRWLSPSPQPGISIGLALLNVGSKIYLINEDKRDPPPTTLSIGMDYLIYRSNNINAQVVADFENQIFEYSIIDFIHLGTEFTLKNIINIRGGYNAGTSGSEKSFFSYGIGVQLKFLSFNIARYNRSLSPTWHVDGTLSLEI
jgi:hypothetical protein